MTTRIIEDEPQPHRIGRYEVLGPLAAGGMAEILLARVVGPHGFERPVVLKRILPHLAARKDLVTMFFDEARLAAAIRHPNVVQVLELGEHDRQPFLAMEYLEGENLSGVMRRLAVRGERMPPELAAWVIASACAGLHAAHELEGPDHQALGLVHRDVSPQNVFVSYDGAIKVIDFGVAKAAGRLTETESGALKGKLGYLSPEQCEGKNVDRRSDVFALGIVLYETMTGRRLFKRASQAETIRAIAAGEVPDPLKAVPDLAPSLVRACLKALARDPSARQPTAAALRTELLAAIREISREPISEDAVSLLVRRLFEDRIAEKKDMMRRLRAGSILSQLPAGDVDLGVEVPAVERDLVDDTRVELPPAGPRLARLAMISAGIATVAFGSFALAWTMAGTSAAEDPPAPIVVAETVEPPPPVEIEDPPSTPIAPAVAHVRVESEPSGATVRIDGEDRGVTPIDLDLTSTDEPRRLELRRDGYVTHVETLADGRDALLHVRLSRPHVRAASEHTGAPREPTPERGFRKFD